MQLSSILASQGYSLTKPATAPVAGSAEKAVAQSVSEFAKVLAEGEQTATAALQSGESPHALVQALTQTEFAVEATVAIRDKVVEAYQEILRMPV